jgi:sec-independent protein translocase protein TatB
MDIFGIGLPEIVFILLLVVIIFGPKDLEKMARTIGSGLSRFFRSDTYRDLRRIGDLPTEIARKVGLDEFRASLDPNRGPKSQNPPAEQSLPPIPQDSEEPIPEPENRIAPPSLDKDKSG